MTISKRSFADKEVVDLIGELDINSALDFQHYVLQELEMIENPKYIELNFADVPYVDSSGLSALLTVWKEAEDKGVSLPLSNVSVDVVKLFEIVGMDELTILD